MCRGIFPHFTPRQITFLIYFGHRSPFTCRRFIYQRYDRQWTLRSRLHFVHVIRNSSVLGYSSGFSNDTSPVFTANIFPRVIRTALLASWRPECALIAFVNSADRDTSAPVDPHPAHASKSRAIVRAPLRHDTPGCCKVRGGIPVSR